jgi:hypothetical protein
MKYNQLDEIEDELIFWEDYILTWEQENGRAAEGRMLEALEAAREKYQNALVLH